jgi:hypothetical protein
MADTGIEVAEPFIAQRPGSLQVKHMMGIGFLAEPKIPDPFIL